METIIHKIKHGFRLSRDEQLEMLSAPNHVELFALYMRKGRYPHLDDDVLCRVFQMKEREALLTLYIKRCPLSKNSQTELFNLGDDFKLLKLYITKAPLYGELQEKLFTLPNSVELLALYVERHQFSYRLHWKLFKIGDDYEVLEKLLGHMDLCQGIEHRLFKLPVSRRATLLGLYLRRHSGRMDMMKKLQKLPEQEREAVMAIVRR